MIRYGLCSEANKADLTFDDGAVELAPFNVVFNDGVPTWQFVADIDVTITAGKRFKVLLPPGSDIAPQVSVVQAEYPAAVSRDTAWFSFQSGLRPTSNDFDATAELFNFLVSAGGPVSLNNLQTAQIIMLGTWPQSTNSPLGGPTVSWKDKLLALKPGDKIKMEPDGIAGVAYNWKVAGTPGVVEAGTEETEFVLVPIAVDADSGGLSGNRTVPDSNLYKTTIVESAVAIEGNQWYVVEPFGGKVLTREFATADPVIYVTPLLGGGFPANTKIKRLEVSAKINPGMTPSDPITLVELAAGMRLGDGVDSPTEPILGIVTRLHATSWAQIESYAPFAPDVVKAEAMVRLASYLYDQPTTSFNDVYSASLRNSGAESLLNPYVQRRAGVIPNG